MGLCGRMRMAWKVSARRKATVKKGTSLSKVERREENRPFPLLPPPPEEEGWSSSRRSWATSVGCDVKKGVSKMSEGMVCV